MGDKEGRGEGNGENFVFSPKSLQDPQHLGFLVQQHGPEDASSSHRVHRGRCPGNIPTTKFIPSGNKYIQVTFDMNLIYANLNVSCKILMKFHTVSRK